MDNIIVGKLVTEWDDGETTIEAACKINLIERTISDVDMNDRSIDSPYDANEVDDAVEHLDRQYVTLPDGQEFPVIEENACSDALEEAEFMTKESGADRLNWEKLPFMLI
jgi:hypothetical protein